MTAEYDTFLAIKANVFEILAFYCKYFQDKAIICMVLVFHWYIKRLFLQSLHFIVNISKKKPIFIQYWL